MVVAQLEVRSLPIPEVPSSNPVVGKIYIEHLFTVNCIEKTKIKKKRPGMAHTNNRTGALWSISTIVNYSCTVGNFLVSTYDSRVVNYNQLAFMRSATGLVVMGGDSRSRGSEFKSWHRMIEMDIFRII